MFLRFYLFVKYFLRCSRAQLDSGEIVAKEFYENVKQWYADGQDLHLVTHADGVWFGATRTLAKPEHGSAIYNGTMQGLRKRLEELQGGKGEDFHHVSNASN